MNTKAMSDWDKKTIDNLNTSQAKDGGYSILVNERPYSFYDTYYNLLIEKAYHNNADCSILVSTLTNNDEFLNRKLENQTDLSELNYLVNIYKCLGVDINQKNKEIIVKQIMLLQDINDGLFKFKKEEQLPISLATTELAIDILNNLGANLDYKRLTSTLTNFYISGQISAIDNDYKDTVYDSVDHIQRLTVGSSYLDQAAGYSKKLELIKKGNDELSRTPTSPLELVNYTAIYHLMLSLNTKPQISSNLIQYLNSIKLPTGGFNLLRKDFADPQMTYKILSIYPVSERPNISIYLRDIQKYRSSNGLYLSMTPIKSNIRNSYMASIIYKDLGVQVPNLLTTFCSSINNGKDLSATDRYYLYKFKQSLGLSTEIARDEYKDLDSYLAVANKDNLYDIGILSEYQQLSEEQKNKIANYVGNLKNNDGGYGFNKVSEFDISIQAVHILVNINRPDTTYSLEQWVSKQQKQDGGFSQSESSDLIDTYYALQILEAGHFRCENLSQIDHYINKLKVTSGGYSFIKDSEKATIPATFFGCECARILKML